MLSYSELVALVDAGAIHGVDPRRINGASIDVTLHHVAMVEPQNGEYIVDLSDKRTLPLREYDFQDGYIDLDPGAFILASTAEFFFLPDNIAAEFKLKSSAARNGLDHSLAGHCDPGWHGSRLTLELQNVCRRAVLRLRPGMPIGQVIFHRVTPVPHDRSYRMTGQYNGDAGPAVRGIR